MTVASPLPCAPAAMPPRDPAGLNLARNAVITDPGRAFADDAAVSIDLDQLPQVTVCTRRGPHASDGQCRQVPAGSPVRQAWFMTAPRLVLAPVTASCQAAAQRVDGEEGALSWFCNVLRRQDWYSSHLRDPSPRSIHLPKETMLGVGP
jgi:hypothetical protein